MLLIKWSTISTSLIAFTLENKIIDTSALPPPIMVTAFLRPHFNLSCIAAIGTSKILTIEEIPATKSEEKNKKPNKSAPAPKLEIILGNAINANPIPPLTTSLTSVPAA